MFSNDDYTSCSFLIANFKGLNTIVRKILQVKLLDLIHEKPKHRIINVVVI